MSGAPRRQGFTALEALFAAALLGAVFLPVYTTLQTSQHVAYLDEFQVLARRRAHRAVAVLEGHEYSVLKAAASGGPPPSDVDPRLRSGSREVFVPFPAGSADVTLENIPAEALADYNRRSGKIPVRAFFQELSPGFARLSILSSWRDPVSRTPRSLVLQRYVEDPFRWSRP
jgi:hypothetical protein